MATIAMSMPIVVKPCYNRRIYQLSLIFIAALYVLFIFVDILFVQDLFMPLFFSETIKEWFEMLFCCGMVWFSLKIKLKKDEAQDQKRQLAAIGQGQTIRLKDKQLIGEKIRLIFPIQTQVFMPLKKTLWWSATIFVIATFISAIAIAQTPYALSKNTFAFFISAIALLVLIAFLTFILDGVAAEKTITINTEGITTKGVGKPRTILWHEAKLFSLPHQSGDTKKIWRFELASQTAIVSWNYIQEPGWMNLAATMPHDEYNRLIDALNNYVVAQTGLPLYDLR